MYSRMQQGACGRRKVASKEREKDNKNRQINEYNKRRTEFVYLNLLAQYLMWYHNDKSDYVT
jgi:hypothetical protein